MNQSLVPAETLICPGHGPLTTVAEEKVNDPFFIDIF
jgi:hydroxyacylglutathione hydrolase